MVVNRYRQHALRAGLTDDVLVQEGFDLNRSRQFGTNRRARGRLRFLTDDVIAKVDALIADEYRRTCDQLADLMLALVAERAMQHFCVCRSLFFRHKCF
ncbi:hypothetical protein D557_3246 [Bordetella holmesii 70147]|nr:hypothetical protein D558_3934 [Bordetella holmesii 44057]EWM45257.1 hypothetical protein D557_3246 [Bordetella holmesii 70147]